MRNCSHCHHISLIFPSDILGTLAYLLAILLLEITLCSSSSGGPVVEC